MNKLDQFYPRAVEVIDHATEKNVVLRFIGATAIWTLARQKSKIQDKFTQIRELTDLDFLAYGRQWGKVLTCFQDLGYTYDERHAALHGHQKIIFRGVDGLYIDVLFDKLEYCHTIDFVKHNRLEVSWPTISAADLLLEKTQIVKINEKDIIDTIILIGSHDVGDSDKDSINCGYIAELLANDWGFCFTVTTNLKKISEDFVEKYRQGGMLAEADAATVRNRVKVILERIEKEPKPFAWKMRARIGPSKKWYRDVEEVIR